MNDLLRLSLVFGSGLLITLLAIPSILEVAYKKQLFDVPDERKVHFKPIPSLGGIGIFIGVIISFTLWAKDLSNFPEYKYVLTAYLVLFFMGLKDDLILMRAYKKFIIQIVVAGMLAYGGVRIYDLQGFLGIHELHAAVSYFLTILFIVGVTNAFNLIDGIDGLAGGLGGINCFTFGALLYMGGMHEYALLAFAVGGSLLGFLRHNFREYPKKIFMGDTGSLLLGLTVSILGIFFLNFSKEGAGLGFISPAVVVLAIMAIPIVDTTRVFIIRIASGKSPFTPDRNHIHHQVLAMGASHKMASLMLYAVNILLVVTVMVFRNTESIGLGLIILFVGTVCTQLFVFGGHLKREQKMANTKNRLEQLEKENQFMNRIA